MDPKIVNKLTVLPTLFLLLLPLIVLASQFIDNSQSDFNQGTYSNTQWNINHIELSSGQTSGTYTSKVFDATADATWNNLTYTAQNTSLNKLYAVDGGGDVFSSLEADTWVQEVDNYERTSDTQYLFADNTYLYIISNSNKEVWRSSDGQSWSVINNTFADSGLLYAEIDSNYNLFVVDASGDLYTSTNDGQTWTLKGDFNGVATNNAKGIAINSTNDIYIVDGSGAVFASTDLGETWEEKTSNYGGGSGTDDMDIDSNGYLYILFNKAVYKSLDSGATWSVINDSFTPYSNDGLRMYIDDNDSFYIADGTGRIFLSTNYGVTWLEKGDFNAGSSSNPKGITSFTRSTNFSFQVRNCSSADCSDGAWQNVNLNDINLAGRYFQYKVSFTSPDSSITPKLYNVTIDYTLLNQQPTISSLTLTPSQPNTTNDLTCSFTITDPDPDSLTANITWYKNTAIYYSSSQAVTNGTQSSSILDSSNTAKNEVWNCTIIPYDGTAYGTQASSSLTIQNSPPTSPNISITPSSPNTNNDLNIVFNTISQDNDGDTISYTYYWYKNSILQPAITGSTVSNGVTSKNQVWLVNITPNDGQVNGEKALSSVIIQNSLPSITSASITPTTAYETTTLTASTQGWSDLDGESENYIYQWFNQSGKITAATSQTITGSSFNKGHQIYCNITPYDSDGYGTSKLTNTVTIQNSLPTITANIVSELGFNGTDEDLTASFTYTDADSDIITNNQTKWYQNNIEQPTLEGLTTISYTNTAADDIWTFSIRINDGEAWSNWYNTSITILDVSQTYPTLVRPSNGTFFNTSNVILTYTTPNYANMNCTLFADTNKNPTTQIKNNTNIQSKTTIIYNWINLADNQYYWKAGCTNNAIMFNSTIKTFTIDTIYPTTAPTLTQSGVSDSDNDGNIELSWTADPDAKTYNIYRDSTKITNTINLTKIGSTQTTTWEDNTTLHNNTYWYALTTVDAAGNENKSIVSDSFNATANDAIIPKLPTNVNATSLNGITTIYWTKVTQDTNQNSDTLALQYKLWYRQNTTVNLSKALVNETADYIKTVSQTSCEETLCQTTHSLSASTQYYYFITTIDDANNENLTLDNNYANVTATTAPPSGGGGSSGGGGGSGGGGTSAGKECKEDWSCSEWYSCINDVQARTCVDVNSCGTEINKPEETRQCGICIEKWQCGDWTPCVNNIQTRVCIDKNDCETEKNIPEMERECAIETCSDGIKNYGEVGIDCGGPCRPCRASDFITGGAIALKSSKGPNPFLLIPTIILLISFIAIKTIRRSDIRFTRVVSALHIPMAVLITALFIFSFFGPQITGFLTAGKEKIEEPLNYTQQKTQPEVAPLIPSTQFNQTKAKIASAIFIVIISIALISLIIKKKILIKLKQKIKPPKTEKIKEKSEVKLPIEEIKDMEIEISSQKQSEVKKDSSSKEKQEIIKENQQNKQEILNQIKEAYSIDKIEK